jgi:hypothetical protein
MEFQARFAGVSFNDGLYRLHGAHSGLLAVEAIAAGFPEFASRATPFAFDWLGRHVALDAMRPSVAGEPQILVLESGTGDALEVPCDFVAFHEVELVEHADAALAREFFMEWAAANPSVVPIGVEYCVGYRIPLFLGGSDTVDNLELGEARVYWSLMGQLSAGAVEPQEDARIRAVRIRDE